MTPLLSSAFLRTQSDARLARLAAQGYERAFEAIVERYRKPLQRYCRALVGEARAEDAVQQSFLNAWSALGGGAQVGELRPWLYRIAHNAAVDTLRRATEELELPEGLASTADPHRDVERRALLAQTLSGVAELPDRQRLALLATVVDGRHQADVARELGLSHGAVRQLVHVARCTLRAQPACSSTHGGPPIGARSRSEPLWPWWGRGSPQ